jgi:hypothetical protein
VILMKLPISLYGIKMLLKTWQSKLSAYLGLSLAKLSLKESHSIATLTIQFWDSFAHNLFTSKMYITMIKTFIHHGLIFSKQTTLSQCTLMDVHIILMVKVNFNKYNCFQMVKIQWLITQTDNSSFPKCT